MRWMVQLYDRVLLLSKHKHAPYYLAAICFVEASVFPIPPYVMLAPMALSRPNNALKYAMIATMASVFGGLLGYLLGMVIFKPLVYPLITYFGYIDIYQKVLNTFDTYGFSALLFLGATPIPYKFIAIGSGFLNVPLHLFILASIVSRGLKFLALAWLIKIGGVDMENYFRKMLERFGIYTMGMLGVLLFVALKVI